MTPETIEVWLKAQDSETDILEFHLEHNLVVNLNSPNCQTELKTVFSALLRKMLINDIILELKVEDGFNRIMYVEVCKEYIGDLNRELIQVASELRSELKRE